MATDLSPWQISCLFLPSKDTQAVFRASLDSMICEEEEEEVVRSC